MLLVIAALNTALTVQRNRVWKNDYTLRAIASKNHQQGKGESQFRRCLFSIKGNVQKLFITSTGQSVLIKIMTNLTTAGLCILRARRIRESHRGL
jgi:hypothetical protein